MTKFLNTIEQEDGSRGKLCEKLNSIISPLGQIQEAKFDKFRLFFMKVCFSMITIELLLKLRRFGLVAIMKVLFSPKILHLS